MSQDSAPQRIISKRTDLETARAVAEARLAEPDTRILAVFEDETLVPVYHDNDNIEAVSWTSELARRLIVDFPVHQRGKMAPPPTIVGCGKLASAIATAFDRHCAGPCGPFDVWWVSDTEEWAQEARHATGSCTEIVWRQATMHPADVARAVRSLHDEWEEPSSERGEVGSGLIVVTHDDEEVGATIGARLRQQMPQARIVVVVDQLDDWARTVDPPKPSFGKKTKPWLRRDGGVEAEEPEIYFWSSSLSRWETISRQEWEEDTLTKLWLAELKWAYSARFERTRPGWARYSSLGDDGAPRALDSVLPEMREKEGRERADGLLGAVKNFADAAQGILAAGRFTLNPDNDCDSWIATPDELRAMAERILKTTIPDPAERSKADWLTAIEVASRLPAIMRLAGKNVGREKDYQPILTSQQVAELAPQVHEAYRKINRRMRNPTRSPNPAKRWEELPRFLQRVNREALAGSAINHAMLGLSWSKDGEQARVRNERLDRLAQLEHRRWAMAQAANGRDKHVYLKPWRQLGAAKNNDRAISLAVIAALGKVGIVLRDNSTEPRGCSFLLRKKYR
ncbi:hypothetical protein [Tessaracoccus sp. OH4464_COT-324]|uniref:hypothetical protein n=1 Tax=Tessaracoccus sp. OH4464_COT-324 TaxID=2491059 RepID=UPI000F6404FF|nr:hypothetical protein [Tessaracoccus sp. OH4464_COT-324]RRD47265.1 hypothetical protein EII42_03115 [Tessaracoccus sp. OH4464_COT-324]